jgi:deferrochelatase/peroxidase EfeB
MTATSATPATPATSAPSALDLADIQGNILRGYRMPNARHFALAIGPPAGAAAFIGKLISGDKQQSPQVTTAVEWQEKPKPEYCLNLGVTAAGLATLGLPPSIVGNFPSAFRAGPAAAAHRLGDVGEADPANWVLGGPKNPAVHLVLSLYTDEARLPRMAPLTALLRTRFAEAGITEVYVQDATAMPDGTVHFGYKDGIAQPRIAGAPGPSKPDMQPDAQPGEFLLGKDYVNQFGGNFLGDLPPALGDNGTYAALRILRQDVIAFEKFLDLAKARFGLEREYTAAKLMGRWRNGTPLVLSPESYSPKPPIPGHRINEFDYGPTDTAPAFFDDREGLRCPVGAHIRRLNPRGATVMGKPHSRRIIRRGIAYGPPFDPTQPDGKERGLVGYFICGDLAMQFEFLLKIWANEDLATAGLRGTRDPLIGAQPDIGGQFVIRTDDHRDPIIFDDLPRLVITTGSVYVFIPGIGGLRFLASLA